MRHLMTSPGWLFVESHRPGPRGSSRVGRRGLVAAPVSSWQDSPSALAPSPSVRRSLRCYGGRVRELRRELEIDAPPERIWAVVTDFGAYPDWNPFIRRISGELREGARLEVRIEPPGARAMTFKPTVRSVEANRELRWLGRLLLPGVFDGEHSLRIEPLDGGRSRFVHRSASAASSSGLSRARSRRPKLASSR